MDSTFAPARTPPFWATRATPAASAEMRAVRGRLQSGSTIEPAFEHELLAMFARNEIRAAVTMPALSLIFSLASMFWAPKYQAWTWR